MPGRRTARLPKWARVRETDVLLPHQGQQGETYYFRPGGIAWTCNHCGLALPLGAHRVVSARQDTIIARYHPWCAESIGLRPG